MKKKHLATKKLNTFSYNFLKHYVSEIFLAETTRKDDHLGGVIKTIPLLTLLELFRLYSKVMCKVGSVSNSFVKHSGKSECQSFQDSVPAL